MAQNHFADAYLNYLIRDRLSWLRFLGFELGAPRPDANTTRLDFGMIRRIIRCLLFREQLIEVGALDTLFTDFDGQLRTRGYLAMGGQIDEAILVATPKQRNTQPEKDAIKEGKAAVRIWPGEPARTAQKDTDVRWTLKFAKGRPAANDKPQVDFAIPSFGCKSSIAICGTFGFVRKGKVTVGAHFHGRILRDVVTNDDTAYRSKANKKC